MVLGATVGNRYTRAADSGFVEMGRNFQQMDNMPAPGTSILVVDDEPQVVWVLQFSLEAEGYQTFAANNGVEALSEISEHRPTMMVLDIMMPTMDGWSVLEAMTELPREERPRVVVVSALASLRDRAKAAELGADAYVPKPFNVDELLEVLHGLERAS
jgi:CheY-like chemotaxis protein